MSIRSNVIFIFLFVQFCSFAQELEWKAGLNYFFDNTEYEKSSLTQDQTMNGVHFSPEIGMSWDSIHGVFGGIDALKISGSKSFLDKVDFTAYYHYKSHNVKFQAGAFPRADLLSDYSDFFFQDSVRNFRPVMQGFYLHVGNNNSFCNLWLDWVSHQTAMDREAFFIGTSAHKSFGLLFADFQSYMFHYANVNPTSPAYHVCDNALGHLSLGVSYSNNQGLDTLLFAVGALGGFERDRGMGDDAYLPIGTVLRFDFEYRNIGLKNTLYVGDPRLALYDKYGGNFYWSNPFLRSKSYLQSKLYLNVIKSTWVASKLGVNLHYSEHKVFFEQTFSVIVSFNSQTKSNGNTSSVFKYTRN